MNKECENIGNDEGFVAHVYKCSEGFDTIGKGYNLSQNPLKLTGFEIKEFRHKGISEATATYLLNRYVEQIEKSLHDKIEWFGKLNEARQGVLINMAYQMGVGGLLKFHDTLDYIQHGSFDLAAAEMLDSKWARQTPARAKRLAKRMKTGAYANG
jgi:lysozyme